MQSKDLCALNYPPERESIRQPDVENGDRDSLTPQDLAYALDRYAPSDVSTLIFSPSLMNGGTCTTRPVSVFAALVTLDAVALFRPGSTSVTVNTTVCGNSMPTALPSKNSTLIWRFEVR